MAKNVEVKAKVEDPAALRVRIEALSDTAVEVLDQEDVFFHAPRGRLKLRTFPDGRGELIAYVRPDEAGPSLLAEQNERAGRVWRAVLELPIKHREVIVMHHFQEMPYREIAAALAVPIGTVMSRLHSARKVLRESLAGDRP